MGKTIRARFSKGVIEPLEELDFEEGKEMTVTILEVPKREKGDPLDTTFGAWADTIDCEELEKNIYADRLIATRPEILTGFLASPKMKTTTDEPSSR